MTVKRTLLTFLRLPTWPSPPFLRLTPPPAHADRKEPSIPVPHSLAMKEEIGSESTGTSQLLVVEVRPFRPSPLLPSGLLSCFFKNILFVFNIVIFCLMSYYSYGYYSLYHCSEFLVLTLLHGSVDLFRFCTRLDILEAVERRCFTPVVFPRLAFKDLQRSRLNRSFLKETHETDL